ncbi:hypothetical protein F4819DRAFT_107146 [Hypoxylon fuscum]|nr:hypothetical protein F4819DRAFT_107146 [Hypoxylon fuscum]
MRLHFQAIGFHILHMYSVIISPMTITALERQAIRGGCSLDRRMSFCSLILSPDLHQQKTCWGLNSRVQACSGDKALLTMVSFLYFLYIFIIFIFKQNLIERD